MIIAAFDPGLSGAVAIGPAKPVEGARSRGIPQWAVFDLPIITITAKQTVINGSALAALLRARRVEMAVIERVHAMPGQGISSTGKFLHAAGQILGVVQALDTPYEFAQPAKWKRDLGLPGGKDKSEFVRARAVALFPTLQAELARKMDHNRAEALLLAHWWINKKESL